MADLDPTLPDREAWELMQRVFEEALSTPEGERAEFLRSRCGGNLRLQSEVESLLASYLEGAEELAPSRFAVNGHVDSQMNFAADYFPGYQLLSELRAAAEMSPATSGQVNDLVVAFYEAAIATHGVSQPADP